MKAFDWQLRKKGYIPMAGQIVDASLVPAPKQRNTDGEKEAVKAGKSAREIWPDKALQIHFPSSVHLSGVKAVEEVGRRYLEEAAPGNGFIAGISEDLPDRGVKTMLPFFRFFHRYGKLPVDPKHFTEEPTR